MRSPKVSPTNNLNANAARRRTLFPFENGYLIFFLGPSPCYFLAVSILVFFFSSCKSFIIILIAVCYPLGIRISSGLCSWLVGRKVRSLQSVNWAWPSKDWKHMKYCNYKALIDIPDYNDLLAWAFCLMICKIEKILTSASKIKNEYYFFHQRSI